MGVFGLRAFKATRLWGTAPYLDRLQQALPSHERKALRLRPDRLETTTRWVDAEGRQRCQGGKDLHQTQAYPLGFGAAHALEFDRWSKSGHPARAVRSPLLELEGAWFLEDLRDPAFHWHRRTAREHQGLKRRRSEA